MFQENSIETCILSRLTQITSPGWMHETSAQTWCTGKTYREWVEREVGSGWGTHVNPWLFHFNVWQNPLQILKKKVYHSVMLQIFNNRYLKLFKYFDGLINTELCFRHVLKVLVIDILCIIKNLSFFVNRLICKRSFLYKGSYGAFLICFLICWTQL